MCLRSRRQERFQRATSEQIVRRETTCKTRLKQVFSAHASRFFLEGARKHFVGRIILDNRPSRRKIPSCVMRGDFELPTVELATVRYSSSPFCCGVPECWAAGLAAIALTLRADGLERSSSRHPNTDAKLFGGRRRRDRLSAALVAAWMSPPAFSHDVTEWNRRLMRMHTDCADGLKSASIRVHLCESAVPFLFAGRLHPWRERSLVWGRISAIASRRSKPRWLV